MNIDDSAERATTFDAEKSPPGDRLDGTESHYQHYKRLSLANDDRYIGKWRDESQQTKKNSSAIVDAVSGQLELTDYQKSESHREFTNLPEDFINSRSTAMVALCVCSLVANRDGRDYHPGDISGNGSDLSDFAEGTGITQARLQSCWIDVRREIDQ